LPAHRPRILRVLSAALALAAIAFVVSVVPVRDLCWDDRSPHATRTTVSRVAEGCVLHIPSGDVFLDARECARLRCEPGLVSAFGHVRLDVLAWLVVLYAAGTLAWAARWRALLRLAGIPLSLLQVWRVSIEAQAGGILLPGGIGGDALRIAWVLRSAKQAGIESPTAIVIASALLDRFVGLAVIAALAATLGFASGGLHAGPLAVVLAAIPVALAGGLAALRWIPLTRVPSLRKGRVGALVGPVLRYLRAPNASRALAIATALSVGVAGVQFATIRGLVFAFGAPVTAEKWVYVGTAMAFIVGAIPALPGAWGTADAAYVFFLGLAGLSAGTALGVSLFYRLFWYLSAMLGALLFVLRSPEGSPIDEGGASRSPSSSPVESSSQPEPRA
jgi:uncharacterized membrane protein YbhN (UPF0104 family)